MSRPDTLAKADFGNHFHACAFVMGSEE